MESMINNSTVHADWAIDKKGKNQPKFKVHTGNMGVKYLFSWLFRLKRIHYYTVYYPFPPQFYERHTSGGEHYIMLMGTKFDKWSTEKILLMSRAWNVEMVALGRWVLSPCSPRIGSFRSFEGCSQGSCTFSPSTSVLQAIFVICLYFRRNL